MWSFSSRTHRLGYLGYSLLTGLLSLFCFNMLHLVLTRGEVTALLLALFTIVFGALAWLSVAAMVRRAHDVGWSSRWLLLSIIPGVGVVQGVLLLILPSEPRANRWGSQAGAKAVRSGA